MILTKEKLLDVDRVGDTEEGIKADIDADNFDFVFRMVSKQMYSYPIESIVREITSNCFDAHIEANNTVDPVLITKGNNPEEGYYIEFRDYGFGMSPLTIVKIYMKYFSSSKRKDNTQHGGFGIGSKTPLSYTDMFYITTIHNGMKYDYLYHEGETKPEIESIYGWEHSLVEVSKFNEELGQDTIVQEEVKVGKGIATTEPSGTNIRIVLKDYSDVSKFTSALKEQLSYFDNVYFVGWGLSNNYRIYEGKNFKFRSDVDQIYTKTHLSIGKTRYPIDFVKLGVNTEYQNIPIAIKFDIGEIKVTPNRENVKYDDETVKLIKDKLDLAVEEIKGLFNSQNPEVETLKEWSKAITEKPMITFNKELQHNLYIWSKSTLAKSFKFKPLEHLKLKKTPNDLLFTWEKVGTVQQSGQIFWYDRTLDNSYILDNVYIIIDKDDKNSVYTNLHIIEKFGTLQVVLVRRKPIDFDNISKKLSLFDKTRPDGTIVPTAGKARTMAGYIKIIDNLVKENATGTYKSLKPTVEWVNAYKRSIIESTKAFQRKKNAKVFVRDAQSSYRGLELSEYELSIRTGMLIYGFKEDRLKLDFIASLFRYKYPYHNKYGNYRSLKAVRVLQIAKGSEKQIQGAKKTLYWERFLKTKMFRKLYSLHLFQEEFKQLSFENLALRHILLPNFTEEYKELSKISTVKRFDLDSMPYLKRHFPTIVQPIESFMEPMYAFKRKYSTLHFPQIAHFEVNRIPLIGAFMGTEIYNEDFYYLVQFLKSKKVRLKNLFYLKDYKDKVFKIGKYAPVIKIVEVIVEKTELEAEIEEAVVQEQLLEQYYAESEQEIAELQEETIIS